MHQSAKKAVEITPDFLNSSLRFAVGQNQTTITDVRQEQLSGNSQYNATLVRLYLTYDRPLLTTPRTLIAKLPTADPELIGNAAVFQPGVRESWFYRSGAPRSPIHVPRCYYSAVDGPTNESILLLEDLAPAAAGNWLQGATINQAELALASLARLQASWWEDKTSPAIAELTHLLTGNEVEEQSLVQELYDMAWPQFLRQGLVTVPNEVRQFGTALAGNMAAVDTLIDQAPKTLVHGDYRLDNLLFGSLDGESICWVIDWEDVFIGSGLVDVAWFLGGCLPVAQSKHETRLLRHYHQTLMAAGVTGYSWARCYHDYRRAMCSSFVQGVLSATLGAEATEYDRNLARAVGQRFVAAAERLQLLAFMP